MRLVLAVGILGVSALVGYARAYALSARISALSCFVDEVPQLLLRMEYETLPLNRLAWGMGERNTLLATFWAEFESALGENGIETAWRGALWKKAPYGLMDTDRSLLQGLGGALAATDGVGRKQAASHIIQETVRQRDSLRQEYARKGSMYGTLGLLLGMAAAIMVI